MKSKFLFPTIFSVLSVISSTTLQAQKDTTFANARDSIAYVHVHGIFGYMITEEGDTVEGVLYKPSWNYFQRKTENGKWKRVGSDEAERIIIADRLWMNFNTSATNMRKKFQEVLLVTETHFLTYYLSDENRQYLFVWDREEYENGGTQVSFAVLMPGDSPARLKKKLKVLEKKVFPYFQSCPYAIKTLRREASREGTDILSLWGLRNYLCGNASSL